MLQVLYERKKLILLVTAAFVLIGSILNVVIYYNKQSMTLSLDYMGIEKGLNPDGSRFNVFEIKSDEVLERTLQKLNLPNLTIADIRDRISIESKMPGNAAQKVKEAKLSGTNYSYIPNEFIISYSQKSKLGKSHTIAFLTALSEAYTEYFNEKYSDKNDVLKVSEHNDSSYEYVEIAGVYQNKINAMIEYLQKRNNENKTFRSDETHQTFLNLITALENLRDIEVEKYRSFVVSSSLAKEQDVYLRKLDYTLSVLKRDYEKAQESTEFTRDAMEQYDPNITGTIFIPSLDIDDKFYMNKTQTGLDYLAQDAYERGIYAEEISAYIDNYEYLVAAFSKTVPTDQHEKNEATAKTLLAEIDQRLLELSGLAYQTDSEYLEEKTRDYLSFEIPKYSVRGFVNLGYMIKLALLGFAISCFYVIIKCYVWVIVSENEVLFSDLGKMVHVETHKEQNHKKQHPDPDGDGGKPDEGGAQE